MPVAAYLLWSVNYSMINFKVAKDRIRRKNHGNMYQLFCNMDIVKKVLGENVTPFGFMMTHFVLFIVNHLLAMLQFHSFWVSTAFVGYYSILSVWNGACYYMSYFAKKYEK